MSEFETILTDVTDGVATITINRPKALNALNLQVLTDITDAATAYDADDSVKAIIITGSEKAFAAGADIKEMSSLDFSTAYKADWFAGWTRLTDVRKPVITAVGGYALGGGCELAMMGDILIASTKAKFGQPEINLGVLPGMGGSQRLTRAVGKAKAMDMCLTGRMMGAEEAERSGLVVMAGVPPFDRFPAMPRTLGRHLARSGRGLDEAARRLCRDRERVVWIDSTGLLPEGRDCFARDGFHPSTAGYALWAAAIWDRAAAAGAHRPPSAAPSPNEPSRER